jgi:predicted dehydrogenase
MGNPLRFAIFGAGFWSRFQLGAWRELEGAECVAVYNRTRSKAEALAGEFAVPTVYDDPKALLASERLDFVDIVTGVDSHEELTCMAAAHGLAVICQKPMAPSLAGAEAMVAACHSAGVPFMVHENWRWQAPIRHVSQVLSEGTIGKPFRARVDMISGHPVFKNQPFLRDLDQFILTDLGSHILDVARFLFGEPTSLYCQHQRVRDDIKGENVATVMTRTERDVTVLCEMAYAENHLERECFPQTLIFVEGDRGSVEVTPDYWVRVTTEAGTLARRCPPPRYGWADPGHDVVHASIVPCQANLLAALRGGPPAETTGDDNLKTVRLVFAAYGSAGLDAVLKQDPAGRWR